MHYNILLTLYALWIPCTIAAGYGVYYAIVKNYAQATLISTLRAFAIYIAISISFHVLYPFPLARSPGLLALEYGVIFIVFAAVFCIISMYSISLSWKRSVVAFLITVGIAMPMMTFIGDALIASSIRVNERTAPSETMVRRHADIFRWIRTSTAQWPWRYAGHAADVFSQ